MNHAKSKKEKINTKRVIAYWLKTSDYDWEAVQSMFERKHYPHALFFAHLVIEKLLKALVVARTGVPAPPVHNLAYLAEKAKLVLDQEQNFHLHEITAFNMEGRYPQDKLKFYRKASAFKYAQKYFRIIQEYRIWLKNIIQSENR